STAGSHAVAHAPDGTAAPLSDRGRQAVAAKPTELSDGERPASVSGRATLDAVVAVGKGASEQPSLAAAWADAATAAGKQGEPPREAVRMYFLVDPKLGMGSGESAGQVAHAAAAWTRRLERSPTPAYLSWLA